MLIVDDVFPIMDTILDATIGIVFSEALVTNQFYARNILFDLRQGYG